MESKSRKVDVYAYGVVLWQLASKQLPYPNMYEALWGERKVAVKYFDFKFLRTPAHTKHFLNEVRVQLGLKHPNIVEMLGASTELVDDDDRTMNDGL